MAQWVKHLLKQWVKHLCVFVCLFAFLCVPRYICGMLGGATPAHSSPASLLEGSVFSWTSHRLALAFP